MSARARRLSRRSLLQFGAPWLPLCLLLLVGGPQTARAGDFSKVEDEYEKAISMVSPATVVCLPKEIPQGAIVDPASGVVLNRKGLILSDGDVGVYFVRQGDGGRPVYSDELEIRLPDLKGRGFDTFSAVVLKRNRDQDTSLIKVLDPPRGGFKYLRVGSSDDLMVGSVTFTMGNAFGLAAEVPPTLTAGIVASLPPSTDRGHGRYHRIYTTAAVNPGVRGGPLVDVEGRLVGTISGAVNPREDEGLQPYQFLGRAVPIDRLKAFYRDVPEAADLFTDARDTQRSKDAAMLETVLHLTGRRAYRATVSLEIERSEPLQMIGPDLRNGRMIPLSRYRGPVTGFLISQDGWIITSLYNLANVTGLEPRMARAANIAHMQVETGLKAITGIRAHLPGGGSAVAKRVAYHEGLGVVLLKADLAGSGGPITETFGEAPEGGDQPAPGQPEEGERPADPDEEGGTPVDTPAAPEAEGRFHLLEPVPADWYQTGRLVLALGNPFGANRLDDPLLAYGVLSKQHPPDIASPWRGQWQTDASATDATAGAPCVDVRGRLIGMLTLWFPHQHGRNSGIGFLVPWSDIEPVLDELKGGRDFTRPYLGISTTDAADGALIAVVSPGGAADKAGLRKGDVIQAIGGKPVEGSADVQAALAGHWSGDTLTFKLRRSGSSATLEVLLGSRGG